MITHKGFPERGIRGSVSYIGFTTNCFMVTAENTTASMAPPEVDFCSKDSNSSSRITQKARYARVTHFKLFCEHTFAV